jgi:opacity protein-like surface antigen
MSESSVRGHRSLKLAAAAALGLVLACSARADVAQDGAPAALTPPVVRERLALLSEAEVLGAGSDGWTFKLAPYAWLPGVDGEISVRESTLDPDPTTNDFGDILDGNLDSGFAMRFEVEKGRAGVFGDFLYVNFSGDRERSGASIEADLSAFIGELGMFFTLVAPEPGATRFPFRLDLLAGARLQSLGVEVDTTNLGSADRERTWVDPIVGARAELGLLKWLSIKARGDIGGFGISEGNTSDFVWNAEAGGSFKLAEWFNIDLGYRWLDYDYEDGSGNDLFRVDATLSGPFIAFEFRF